MWLNPSSVASWKSIEQNILLPHRLQDFIYSNIPSNNCTQYGVIITEIIRTWNHLNSHCKTKSQWFSHTPIFYNHCLKIRNLPISFPQWSGKLYALGDVCNTSGLLTFQELQQKYNLPGTSFFLYLQLRTAMRTYGVPWNTPLSAHPAHSIFCKGKVLFLECTLFYRKPRIIL